MRNFDAFFEDATGYAPFDYQRRLAEETWPDLAQIPTGLGKTAAVIVTWLYRRREIKDHNTPRRLVYCLPMRTLVEQTSAFARSCLERLELSGRPGEGGVSVHELMGGAEDLRKATWAEHPEEEAILIGTQDQLLSRSLMRGYAMSRYQWPIHFALLHNDALWVYDEVQLMGPGLLSSAQLEAFRRSIDLAKPSRSVWLSATLNSRWLDTIDLRPHVGNLRALELSAADRKLPIVKKRLEASKQIERADTRLTSAGGRKGMEGYAKELAREVLDRHRAGCRTIVILNRVDRAQAVYGQLQKRKSDATLLLVHSRFRSPDRERIQQALASEAPLSGQIVVATQAIEAGVDVTSAVMFTELAPWSSIVQRLGRCNRYGEEELATVVWIDIESEEELALPYDGFRLARSRVLLKDLKTASPGALPPIEEEAPRGLVLRKKDFLDLFNTDPDLSGFDVDVSPFIRAPGPPQVEVFWRDIDESPGNDQTAPSREELCSVSLTQIQEHLGKGRSRHLSWVWNPLGRVGYRTRRKRAGGRWERVDGGLIRPGMTLLLRARDGGYVPERGFVANDRASVRVLDPADLDLDSYGSDPRSVTNKPIELSTHLADAAAEARTLCVSLDEANGDAVVMAAAWHDFGKSHPVFQDTLTRCETGPERSRLWAKSPCRGWHSRRHFRHELASMLAWLEHREDGANRDLIAYLIAAHHGKVRMGLRALPGEQQPDDPNSTRFARGIHEGDILPEVLIDGSRIPATTLRLDLMELGSGRQGPSWAERTSGLLQELGPFRLAWLEMLVRIADWRASRKEQEEA